MASRSQFSSRATRRRVLGVRLATLMLLATGCSAADIASSPESGALPEASRPALATTPSGQDPRWEELPPLPVPLREHGLVVFRDCLWTIGGEVGPGSVRTSAVYRYCPDRDASRWRAGPSLPEAFSSFVGVGVVDDRIYVAGGMDQSGSARRTVYAFDPGSGWSRLADSLPTRMACGGGVTLEGKLFVYGGLPWTDYVQNCDYRRTPNELAVFDPSRPTGQRWTRVGPSPFAETVCGYRLAAVDRQVYIVGGGECTLYHNHPHPFVYDVASGGWVPASTYFSYNLWPGVAIVGRTVVTLGGTASDYWYSIASYAYAVHLDTRSGGPLPLLPEEKMNAPTVNFRGDVVIVGNGTSSIGGASNQVLRYRMAQGCDLYEPDDQPAKAVALSLSSSFDRGGRFWGWGTTLGMICGPEDVDYIRLEDLFGYHHRAEVRLAPPPGTDFELALMDPSGSRVLARSARGGSAIESIRLSGQDASYLLRIRSQNGSYDRHRPYNLELADESNFATGPQPLVSRTVRSARTVRTEEATGR
jgi:Kelch motif